MTTTPVFLREVLASASEFPVPRAPCCCSTPYPQNSLPLKPARVALFPDIEVDQRAANGLTAPSSAISGVTAAVKSP